MRKPRLLRYGPFGFVLIAGLIFAYLYLAVLPSRRFDRETWLHADPATQARSNMIPYLLNRTDIHAMSRSELIAMLGPPNPLPNGPAYAWKDVDIAYVLGPSRWGPGRDWLAFEFDARGRVTSVGLLQDAPPVPEP